MADKQKPQLRKIMDGRKEREGHNSNNLLRWSWGVVVRTVIRDIHKGRKYPVSVRNLTLAPTYSITAEVKQSGVFGGGIIFPRKLSIK